MDTLCSVFWGCSAGVNFCGWALLVCFVHGGGVVVGEFVDWWFCRILVLA